ncbi:TPA: hypothetical protein N0F65_006672 [Lagenidium giganteum]|uniref:Xaa-Pro dipeptidyl-peptidase C-terminal domain-containing protein n=1 Tax=Lagenidium giganteum TaxID=4803 RepID=A0AAV2Z8T9_9STRA|nr:TPA: hypothetical protein N0F65_006672 [Lagenidium giganteum]
MAPGGGNAALAFLNLPAPVDSNQNSQPAFTMADAAAAAPAARPSSNVNHYMKSAFISMISISVISTSVNWIMEREEPIPCGPGVNDNQWLPKRYQSLPFFDPATAVHESQYVRMRDGKDLAVDSYVAKYLKQEGEKVPTIIHYTRHGRGYTLDFPFNVFTQYEAKFTNPRTNVYVQRFVSNGYAWVTAEVRGTGVSEGAKKHDFNDQEVTDGFDLVDWVTKQPWSNGEVAAFGHGFEGVGALLLAASKHPAIKAVSLNGAAVDTFQAALFPGGVKNKKALNDFTSFTYDTDRQIRWREIPQMKARMMMKHFGGNVYPVDNNVTKLRQAVAQHANNPNLTTELENVQFRDDVLAKVNVPASQLDATRFLADIASSGAAIHSFAGYYDMAVARSSIQLHQYLTNTLDKDTTSLLPKLPEEALKHASKHRLTVGPWSHAGVDNTDPFAQAKQKCFWHMDEISRFFDYHMFPQRREYTGMDGEEQVHYYTLVHGKWKSTPVWPPAHIDEQKVFYMGDDQKMEEVNTPSGESSLAIEHNPKYDIVSRWDMVGHMFGIRPYYYHDRLEMESSYVTFLTPELTFMEITGQPELRLFFSVDKPNVNLVAYLEDVDYQPPFKNENKRRGITYITEALLNPVHQTISPDSSVHSFLKKDGRKIEAGKVYEAVLRFEPVSYILKRNHQLRVSIGVAPQKDFGDSEAAKLTVHFGGEYPTALKLPVYEGLFTHNIVPTPEEDEEAIPVPAQSPEPASASDEDEFADETEPVPAPAAKAPAAEPVKEEEATKDEL